MKLLGITASGHGDGSLRKSDAPAAYNSFQIINIRYGTKRLKKCVVSFHLSSY